PRARTEEEASCLGRCARLSGSGTCFMKSAHEVSSAPPCSLGFGKKKECRKSRACTKAEDAETRVTRRDLVRKKLSFETKRMASSIAVSCLGPKCPEKATKCRKPAREIERHASTSQSRR